MVVTNQDVLPSMITEHTWQDVVHSDYYVTLIVCHEFSLAGFDLDYFQCCDWSPFGQLNSHMTVTDPGFPRGCACPKGWC